MSLQNITAPAAAQVYPPLSDENLIREALDVLFLSDAVVELRALFQHGRKRTDAGYFDGEHREEMIREAVRLNQEGAAVYVTLNVINPQLLARYANHIEKYASATTCDKDIIRREWLLHDFDPVRPSGTSATAAQLEAARESALHCGAFLHEQGWPEPLISMSGNGYHLLYRVDLPNDKETTELFKAFLAFLAHRFDNDMVKLDTSVYNAARIVKLYGTVANKGDHTAQAPHRLSHLMHTHVQDIVVSVEQLRALLPASTSKPAYQPSAHNGQFDLPAFLERLGIGYKQDAYQGGERYKLDHCPFNPEHGSGEAAIFRWADGRLGFKCQHNSCADKHWRDVRALVKDEGPTTDVAGNDAGDGGPPDPDTTILRQGRRKPPQFSLALLGAEWSDWLSAAAEGAGAPVDYVAGALLAGAAATIGNARSISPWAGWGEPSALWVADVGRPSSGKSPGADPVLHIVRDIEKGMTAGFEEKQRKWETQKKAAGYAREQWEIAVKKAVKEGKVPPDMPAVAVEPPEIVRPRIVANDTSTEKLGLLLAAHEKGLLYFRDELSGWLGSFDRYSGSGADRGFWNEAYGGRPYTIDRVKHPLPIQIPHLLVSVMGGIQPDKLHDLFHDADDGLTSRFLWLWPDPIPPYRPQRHANPARAAAAFHRLASLKPEYITGAGAGQPRILMLSAEASELLQVWRNKHHKDEQNSVGLLASSYGKAPGHVLRLALVIEYLWWAVAPEAPEPTVISAKAIAVAVQLMDTYFKPMAECVFGDASVPESERLADTLARWIVKNRPTVINLRKLSRTAKLAGLREPEKVKVAADALVDASWLIPPPPVNERGRPRGDYTVNPKLWEVLSQS